MGRVLGNAIATSVLVAGGAVLANERPNILWLTSEDNNTSWIGCYGSKNAQTPNIDKLATEGFQYMHAYANAPVCAPSRSTWITGVNALSMGTHPMRSRYAIPHDIIKYYPDHLKAAGYYVSNVGKTDYNISGRSDRAAWDSGKANWDVLKTKQPFFQVINTKASHESKAQGSVEDTKHNPADMTLRSYHPDIPGIRKNYAKYSDAITNMDNDIGAALEALEKSGMAENTIVIYNSDHGGVLPRSKRFLFDSGLHSPFIIRIPEKFKHLWPAEKPGMKVDRLVSFVDMPKTWLSITGAEVPDYMQGTVFLGKDTEDELEFHHAFRARMDERTDNVRAVHDKRFLYIKNYMPYVPWGQRLHYLWLMEASQAWDDHHKAGLTNELTGRYFGLKTVEELYDTKNDPDSVNNLINSPEYASVVKRMRSSLNQWQKKIYDAGMLPECDVVKRAADNKMTIYEMVRKPELYDLDGYMAAADVALAEDPANLKALTDMFDHKDSGIRYWGMVGCLMLNEKAAPAKDKIESLLTDESHVVRALAAWSLCKLGETDKGINTLKNLVETKSYALLEVANILDYMGEDAKPAVAVLMNLDNDDKNIQRHQKYLPVKLGLVAPKGPKSSKVAKAKK